MTAGDLLLSWVSCYRELRIDRVQRAAERLCERPAPIPDDDWRRASRRRDALRLVWSLERLGHIERHKKDYRIVPSILVSTGPERHVLVGARDENLINQLENEARALVVREPQAAGPSVLWVETNDAAIAEAAARLGIARVRERGLDLLASLPPLVDLLANAPRESLPEKVQRWVPVSRQWTKAPTGAGELGLHRTVRRPRQWYWIPSDGGPTLRLDSPELRAAAAWSLAEDKIIRLDRGRGELRVPLMPFALPPMVDRALILASGRLPEFDRQEGWMYYRIAPKRARQVARVVGARVEETA